MEMGKAPIFDLLDSVSEDLYWVEENDHYHIKFFLTEKVSFSDLGSPIGFDMVAINHIYFDDESTKIITSNKDFVIGTWVEIHYKVPLTGSEFDELVDVLEIE
jgi:hypothetical protein